MEFIKGNYYRSIGTDNKKNILYIWLCGENNQRYYSHRVFQDPNNDLNIDTSSHYAKNSTHGWFENIDATPEEVEWLNLCIKYDKYISYDEFLTPKQHTKPDPELKQILIKLLT